MGRIIAVEYLTLDGVFEEPAWTQPYFDEAVGAYQGEAMGGPTRCCWAGSRTTA